MQNKTHHIIQRLGLWYSLYRLILACCLMAIFLITYDQLRLQYEYPKLYFYSSILYIIITFLQMTLMRYYRPNSSAHLIALFALDVLILSSMIFSLRHGANLQISLIYMITVFLSSILLDKKLSLIITLTAIISVTYQNFIGGLFNDQLLKNFPNNIFLAFLFLVMYSIGRIAIERFKILENIAIHQTEELNQLQHINQSIMQQIDVGYLLINQQFEIILTNPMTCQLLGLPPLISFEKYPLEVWHDEFFNFLKQNHLLMMTSQMAHHSLYFHCHLSGYKMNIKWHTIHTGTEQMTLFILKDMQDINQQVQQLKLAALGQLSASIAHEIRNPLSAIVQANDLLKDELSEHTLMLSNIITKQSERINQIIHSTLSMAKNDATQSVEINLNQFIYDIVQEDLSDVMSKISLEIAENSSIYFDKNQLRQVIVNLARNALRHNHSDKQIIIRTQPFDRHTWIDVIDFGHGVDKSQQANLFKPFFSTEINGTGLGLYLSSNFCEANHATLRYVDQHDIGACFRIEGLTYRLINS